MKTKLIKLTENDIYPIIESVINEISWQMSHDAKEKAEDGPYWSHINYLSENLLELFEDNYDEGYDWREIYNASEELFEAFDEVNENYDYSETTQFFKKYYPMVKTINKYCNSVLFDEEDGGLDINRDIIPTLQSICDFCSRKENQVENISNIADFKFRKKHNNISYRDYHNMMVDKYDKYWEENGSDDGFEDTLNDTEKKFFEYDD